jgi:hypothetical protein
MEDHRTIKAIQIGGLAREVLIPGTKGSVMGVTSTGIFLNAANVILFITEVPYNSPYNIQVETMARLTPQISIGDAWSVEGEQIIFDRTHFQVDFETAQVWKPSPPKSADNLKVEQIKRMDVLLERFTALDPGKGWLFLREAGRVSGATKSVLEAQRVHHWTEQFIADVRRPDLPTCLESARPILGLGGGLTPSGDDWLTGFFLYFARANRQDQFMLDLGEAITSMALERTTSISANRIKAACQGWAEEIFLEVLDHLLVSSVELTDEKIQRLANFGHSSGVDTCMGIYSALSLD